MKNIEQEQSKITYSIDGHEVTATFAEEINPDVFPRVKQILLSTADLTKMMDAA